MREAGAAMRGIRFTGCADHRGFLFLPPVVRGCLVFVEFREFPPSRTRATRWNRRFFVSAPCRSRIDSLFSYVLVLSHSFRHGRTNSIAGSVVPQLAKFQRTVTAEKVAAKRVDTD